MLDAQLQAAFAPPEPLVAPYQPPPTVMPTRRNSIRWSTSGGYWKHHELPHFCPHDFAQLSYHARRALRRMRRRPTLVMAFWEQAERFRDPSTRSSRG